MHNNIEFIKSIAKEIPLNIFFKDAQCRYVFATHYWEHLNKNGEEWSINGKTDLEIRKDYNNAKLAYEQDKKIIETGKGCHYIIEECYDEKIDYLEIIKNPVRDENGKIIGIVGVINNITEKVNLSKSLEVYSATDVLTGIYNKTGLFSNIHKVTDISQVRHEKTIMIVLNCLFSNVIKECKADNILITSNIIRVPQTDDKICARVDEDVFVIVKSFDENIDENVSEYMRIIENKVKSVMMELYEHDIKIIYEYREVTPDNAEKTLNSLYNYLKVKIEDESKSYKDYKNQFVKLRRAIYLNPQKDWNISEIIDSFGMSKAHFHRVYKILFATSCHDDVIEARIEKAKKLLSETSMRIHEISEACGYSENGHFIRQFKNKTGITASQYRKKFNN